MKTRKCLACGYVYDSAVGLSDTGIASGTLFELLSEYRVFRLLCGTAKKVLLKKSNSL
jgi:rubredoxin